MGSEQVDILISHPLEEIHLRTLRAVDGRIFLEDVSQEYGALLRARARGQETVPFSPNLVDMLGRAEVTLALRVLPELKSLAPRLRWVQLVSAGNETAARNMVPSMVRGKARVVKVDRFTPEQIRAMHKAA